MLVHGKDQQQHDERLEAVLKRLLEAGVTLNLDKCVFSTKQVKFLGHVISSNGIEVDPDKIKAIADLPPPTNVQEVRMFLGMVNKQVFRSPRRQDKKHQRASPKREPVDMGKRPEESFQANQSGSRESSRTSPI